MSGLKEDLAELAATLPLLAGEVAELVQRADALGAATTALANDARNARDEIETALSGTRSALPALDAELKALAQRLENATTGAAGTWESPEARLTSAMEALEEAADPVDAARREAQERIVQAAARVAQGGEDGGAVGDLETVAVEGQERLANASATAADHASSLRDRIEGVATSLGEAAEALGRQMVTLTVRVRGEGGFVIEELAWRMLSEHDMRLQAAALDVSTGSSHAAEHLEGRLHDVVRVPATLAGEELIPPAETLRTELTASTAKVVQARTDLVPALGRLEDVTSPLPDVLAQVTEAAERLENL